MARVWYGGIITEMKGSIGGTTFQSNAAAKIAKQRSSRRKQNTSLQNLAITTFQQVQLNWQNINQAQKSLWNDFAGLHTKENRWGETKVMTGFNWFLSINTNLFLIDESLLVVPPVWESPLPVSAYDGAFIPSDTYINFIEPFAHSNHYILMYTSHLLRTVSTANRKVLRLTKIIEPGISDFVYFEDDWVATHNVPVPIPGDPVNNQIFCALTTVHKSKGISSVFNSIYIVYEPS